jgi:excinuclease ABC subunit C
MVEAVSKKAFEQAAKYRDRLQALSVLTEKQYAILTSGHNQDVLAVAKDEVNAVIALFMIRNGHIIRTEHFNLTDQSKEETSRKHAGIFYSTILYRCQLYP